MTFEKQKSRTIWVQELFERKAVVFVSVCVRARVHVRAVGSRDTIREDWANYLSQLLIFEHPDENHSKKIIFHSGEKRISASLSTLSPEII